MQRTGGNASRPLFFVLYGLCKLYDLKNDFSTEVQVCDRLHHLPSVVGPDLLIGDVELIGLFIRINPGDHFLRCADVIDVAVKAANDLRRAQRRLFDQPAHPVFILICLLMLQSSECDEPYECWYKDYCRGLRNNN